LIICNVEKLLAITTPAWVTSACRRYQDPGGTSRWRDGYAYHRFQGCASSGEDEDKPGVILDYDDGNLVSIEVLDASVRAQAPGTVTLVTQG